MLAGVIAVALVVALLVAPFVWRNAQDRRRDRAERVRAEIHAATVRALGGESFVTVQATPPGFGRPGRVVVAAPSGYESLVERVWPRVIGLVPRDYELVVKEASGVEARAA
ncbi:MAG TPA: hypothetical protein VNN07_03725 [Candidatus Tectomicrobia bacterium]|nr:hypothetical protein [Candidatus Tectomicrobia bacterium]